MRNLLAWILFCCGLALAFLVCQQAFSQTTLMPPPKVQFFNGAVPVAGGCVGTYQSGTLTLLNSFTDNTGLTPNTNPVTLDANGMAPIWLSSSATYRIIVYQAPSFPFTCATGPGPQLYLVDGVVGVGGGSGGGTVSLSGNNAWTGNETHSGSETFSGPLVAPKIGPSVAQQHTLPAVASDTFALLAATQTFTNKTFTNPTVTTGTFTSPTLNTATLSNPTINTVLVNGQPGTYIGLFNNDGVTGTATNTLTSVTAGETGIKTSAGATGGVLGICVSNCGTSGIPVIQTTGVATCVFDGTANNTHYVQISATTAGNCHDTGSASYPTSGGQVIGIVFNGGAQQINLFSPEIQPGAVQFSRADVTGLGANTGPTTVFTPTTNGYYMATCYVVVTTAATTSSTLPSCKFNFTDADTSVAESNFILSTTNTGNTVGTVGATGGQQVYGFFAKGGSAIQYVTSGYLSSGATSMVYALHFRVIGPF